MSKRVKTIVVIATAMIAAGVILSVAGFAFGGFRSVQFGSGGLYIEEGEGGWRGAGIISSRTFDDIEVNGIDSIDIEVDMYSVTLREGDEDEYEIEVQNLYAREMPIGRVRDGVLTIRENRDATARAGEGDLFGNGVWRLLQHIRNANDVDDIPRIEITYPRGARFDSVSVDDAAGSVEIRGLSAASLSVDCAAGSLNIREAATDDLSVKMSMGECEIRDVRAGKAVVEMDAGSFFAREFDCGALDGTLRMGDIDVEGSLHGDVNISADAGSVSLRTDLPESEYSVDLNVEMGGVTVGKRDVSDGISANFQASPDTARYRIHIEANMGDVELDFI
jgi:hypothetical protein